ncbi:MAG: hypothetical protein SPI58_02755, partial [Candidatus Enteromonas sp.]|nr:hypothetical protein [Candidatus Enteromonas sp.]
LETVHRHCLYPFNRMGERFEMRLSRILFAFSGKAKTARYYASIPPRLVKEEKQRIKAMEMTKLR